MQIQQPSKAKKTPWPAFLLTVAVAVAMLLGPNALQNALGVNTEEPKSDKSSVAVLGGIAAGWTVSVDLGDAGYECYTQLGEVLQDRRVHCAGGKPTEKWSFLTDWREGFDEQDNELVLRRTLRALTHTNDYDDVEFEQRDVPGDDRLKVLVSDVIDSAGGFGMESEHTVVMGFVRTDQPGSVVTATLQSSDPMDLNSHESLLIANARLEED